MIEVSLYIIETIIGSSADTFKSSLDVLKVPVSLLFDIHGGVVFLGVKLEFYLIPVILEPCVNAVALKFLLNSQLDDIYNRNIYLP